MSSTPLQTTPNITPPLNHPSRSNSSSENVEEPELAGASQSPPHPALLDAVKDVREIVRLVQCPVCSRILQDPVTLPCGKSLCRRCLPETHTRTNISWPATANRMQGFECPFEDCKKEHASGDCSADVTLNKVLSTIREEISRNRSELDSSTVSTCVKVRDQWDIPGVPLLKEKSPEARVIQGGRIVATYMLAQNGEFAYNAELSYAEVPTVQEQTRSLDVTIFTNLKDHVRTEMDCQVCYALYLDPLTTSCGHTFCRQCLHRVLDHSEHCPICRRSLSVQTQLSPHSFPTNQRISKMIEGFWADIVDTRAEAVRAEQQSRLGEFDIPIFICTLSFPAMPTFLHIFEPRYRLMIRRAMEGDRTFGMVMYSRPRSHNEPHFLEYGTLLRIVNLEYFPDGRSLIETVGVSRFRVTRHGMLDGYSVGKIEKIDDICLADQESAEASETLQAQGVRNFAEPAEGEGDTSASSIRGAPRSPTTRPPIPTSDAELDNMSTRELTGFCVDFVAKMRAQSVGWLTARVLAIYGECPSDPAIFPWWFGSILPVRDSEKYRLLSTTSVRERLKICCAWIIEWESSR